jgi:hypothetical protein
MNLVVVLLSEGIIVDSASSFVSDRHHKYRFVEREHQLSANAAEGLHGQGAATALTGKAHLNAHSLNGDKFNIAAIGLNCRTHLREDA